MFYLVRNEVEKKELVTPSKVTPSYRQQRLGSDKNIFLPRESMGGCRSRVKGL